MRTKTMLGLVVAGAAVLAACGTGSYNGSAHAATKTPHRTNTVTVTGSRFGDHLVDGRGRTLYGFTNDMNGTSSCNGTCTQSWPPLVVSANWRAAPGTASANLHTVKRDDGQLQLVAGTWPLYTFAGDRSAGDLNGQGSLGKWFVVQPDGALHKGTASSGMPSSAMSASGY